MIVNVSVLILFIEDFYLVSLDFVNGPFTACTVNVSHVADSSDDVHAGAFLQLVQVQALRPLPSGDVMPGCLEDSVPFSVFVSVAGS